MCWHPDGTLGTKVHRGFNGLCNSIFPVLVAKLQATGWPITRLELGGHSLGGALAVLSAMRFEAEPFEVVSSRDALPFSFAHGARGSTTAGAALSAEEQQARPVGVVASLVTTSGQPMVSDASEEDAAVVQAVCVSSLSLSLSLSLALALSLSLSLPRSRSGSPIARAHTHISPCWFDHPHRPAQDSVSPQADATCTVGRLDGFCCTQVGQAAPHPERQGPGVRVVVRSISPNGGHFDFARSSARTHHEAYV